MFKGLESFRGPNFRGYRDCGTSLPELRMCGRDEVGGVLGNSLRLRFTASVNVPWQQIGLIPGQCFAMSLRQQESQAPQKVQRGVNTRPTCPSIFIAHENADHSSIIQLSLDVLRVVLTYTSAQLQNACGEWLLECG